jgi:nucleoid DNA-binding protein
MERYEDLPERIQRHLQSITESSGLPPGEESLRRITENWLEKRRLFREQSASLDMHELEEFAVDDPRGVLALTYSGSLVSLGPSSGDGGDGRRFEYASIKLRADVPDLVAEEGIALAEPLQRDRAAVFTGSSIEKSSPVLHLVACEAGVSPADQERRLREATIFLTNGFVKLNRTLTVPAGEIDHFTTKSMVQYVAKKNGITQTLARQVIDDFLMTAESGALLGERVPLGRLGRIYVGVRPAQKARMGRNPATGEEMLIPAKPESGVPKLSFSKHMKERAAAAEVTVTDEEDQEP